MKPFWFIAFFFISVLSYAESNIVVYYEYTADGYVLFANNNEDHTLFVEFDFDLNNLRVVREGPSSIEVPANSVKHKLLDLVVLKRLKLYSFQYTYKVSLERDYTKIFDEETLRDIAAVQDSISNSEINDKVKVAKVEESLKVSDTILVVEVPAIKIEKIVQEDPLPVELKTPVPVEPLDVTENTDVKVAEEKTHIEGETIVAPTVVVVPELNKTEVNQEIVSDSIISAKEVPANVVIAESEESQDIQETPEVVETKAEPELIPDPIPTVETYGNINKEVAIVKEPIAVIVPIPSDVDKTKPEPQKVTQIEGETIVAPAVVVVPELNKTEVNQEIISDSIISTKEVPANVVIAESEESQGIQETPKVVETKAELELIPDPIPTVETDGNINKVVAIVKEPIAVIVPIPSDVDQTKPEPQKVIQIEGETIVAPAVVVVPELNNTEVNQEIVSDSIISAKELPTTVVIADSKDPQDIEETPKVVETKAEPELIPDPIPTVETDGNINKEVAIVKEPIALIDTIPSAAVEMKPEPKKEIKRRFESTTKYKAAFKYQLPFSKGNTFKVFQGYNGTVSHQNQFALDFDMPIGTQVHAVREGIVSEIVQTNSEGCGTEECSKYDNYILVHHRDGSYAKYAHLKEQSAAVSEGDLIGPGQFLAYSGNTGWTTTPSLHIEILRLIDDELKTVKANFLTGDGNDYGLLMEGMYYKRDY